MKLPLAKKLFISIFILFISGISYASPNDELMNTLIRNIGHKFLLELKDSTSRILPVENKEHGFVLSFENEISFDPEQLYTKVYDVFRSHRVEQSFIVEVLTCSSDEVVYSFKASLQKDDAVLNCKERVLPKACYQIYFRMLLEDEVSSNQSESALGKTSILISTAVITLLLLFIYRKKKSVNSEDGLISVGKYTFDAKRMELLYGDEATELSAMEGELLSLFLKHKNETLKREFILNEVWEDEGNYVGRTLDVFISKLRKKLEEDKSIKIVSVRGVGYKFVN